MSGTSPGFQGKARARPDPKPPQGSAGVGCLTVAIRVIERHSSRARGQQGLLQRGGGDVFGVEQAGAMACGSKGHICGERKQPR